MALLKVNKSAQVLFLKPSTDRNHPSVLLCYDPTMRNEKWIVWLADDNGNTVAGSFHSTLEEARVDFDARAEGTAAISN